HRGLVSTFVGPNLLPGVEIPNMYTVPRRGGNQTGIRRDGHAPSRLPGGAQPTQVFSRGAIPNMNAAPRIIAPMACIWYYHQLSIGAECHIGRIKLHAWVPQAP